MAAPARHRPGCNSAMPARGGCRSRARARWPPQRRTCIPNAETWLDFTDLVFIDPVGTGYSRFVAGGDDVRRHIWSVDGDVDVDFGGDPPLAGEERPAAVAEICRGRKLWRHSRAEGREQSADQAGRRRARADPGLARARFPRLVRIEPAAACRALADHGGGGARGEGAGRRTRISPTSSAMRAANSCTDLAKGQADVEATNRMADKVASLTGIDAAVTRRLAGRLSVGEFRREFDRKNGKVTGRYDASVMGFDPYPELELRAVRRSLRRFIDGAVDQCRRRSHHAQAQLAAGRLVPSPQRSRRQCLEFRPRSQPRRVGLGAASVARARSEA